MRIFILIGILAVPFQALAQSENVFVEDIAKCAVSSGIEIDSNLKGSLKSIFSGSGAQGNTKISMPSFLDKFDSEEMKFKAYQLYVKCISDGEK